MIATGSAGPAIAQPLKVLRVTAIPGESPAEVTRRFGPLGRYLETKLDMRVEWVPVLDYDAVVDGLVHKKIDLALVGGFTFVLANARTGGRIVPLVQRESDGEYRSVFITRAGSGIKRLEDLKGRSISFGPGSSTSGHLMPRAALLNARIRPEADLTRVLYASGHDAVVSAVLGGRADAGALNIYIWERLVTEKKVDTAVVTEFFTTPPYYDTSWSVHADMPAATRERIKTAFLKLDATKPDEKEILDLQRSTKFVPTRVENYQRIKAAAENAGLLK
ncbi:putative selenate ABC transporter substrate-binding protein [Roseateles sp. L2-2]|uniref:putative selenate ABC transporter substrate-binding protein n=1 Tax=Roseateles sp. L2-2 TaxID=3422597 RepID=UPI003D362FB7